MFCLFHAVQMNPVNISWWFRFHSLNMILYDNIDVNLIVFQTIRFKGPVAHENDAFIDNPQQRPCKQEPFNIIYEQRKGVITQVYEDLRGAWEASWNIEVKSRVISLLHIHYKEPSTSVSLHFHTRQQRNLVSLCQSAGNKFAVTSAQWQQSSVMTTVVLVTKALNACFSLTWSFSFC